MKIGSNYQQFRYTLTLLLTMILSLGLAGCSGPYTTTIGKTTINDVTKELGNPENKIQVIINNHEVNRLRWWRTSFIGHTQKITKNLTFYDGEFQQDGMLTHWRAVSSSVPLEDAYGFDFDLKKVDKNLDWSKGYLRQDGTFVSDRTAIKTGEWFPNNVWMKIDGVSIMGEIIGR